MVEACQHFFRPHEHVRGELAAFAVQELGTLGPCGEVLGRLLIRHVGGCGSGRRIGVGVDDEGNATWTCHCRLASIHMCRRMSSGDVALSIPGLVRRAPHDVAVDEGVCYRPDEDVLGGGDERQRGRAVNALR